MRPAITGTFPPPATRFDEREQSATDGSIRLLIYEMLPGDTLQSIMVFVSDADHYLRQAGDLLSNIITEDTIGGVRRFYLMLHQSMLHPGMHTANVKCICTDSEGQRQVYGPQIPFNVPDTPFLQTGTFSFDFPVISLDGLVLPEGLTNIIGPVNSTTFTYFSGDLDNGNYQALRYDINNTYTSNTGPPENKPVTLAEFELLVYS